MLDFVLNFLFPPVCGICGKLDDKWLCDKCRKRLKKYEKFELIIGKEKINSLFKFQENQFFINADYYFMDLCSNTLKINDCELRSENFKKYKSIYFDEFLYCFEYKKLIRSLLLRYKFSDCGYLSNLFANVILNNKKINEILESYDIMFPVPMDKKKKSIRGYNQTELITKCFEKYIKNNENYNFNRINNNKNYNLNKIKNNSKIEIINDCLIKVKNTKTQSTLSAEKRTENIKNAFLVKDKLKIENKKIVLFDDIATTGSTVNEISKILKNAGARRILVLVIAKD